MAEDQGGYRQINKSLNICVFEEYLRGQNANLPKLDHVEQVSPRVLRVLGQNPGKFTLQGTNTFIVGTGEQRLLIDTSGGEPEWASLIASTLEDQNISLSHVLLTHWHGDHTGGVKDLLCLYPHLQGCIYKNDPEKGQTDIKDGQIFEVPGATVRAVHTPGHSEDHMCFVLEEESALFTGDNVLGHGTSAVEDLAVFMTTLVKMQNQACSLGYPAHGVVIQDLPAKMASELQRKHRRENQIMQALSTAHARGEKSITVADLVQDMYGEAVDEETRILALIPMMTEVLCKLAGDGRTAFQVVGGVKKWYSFEKSRPAMSQRTIEKERERKDSLIGVQALEEIFASA
ncbi:Metallo-hydrolase/oxidoreductase, partial [Aureobasidium melanogenum]